MTQQEFDEFVEIRLSKIKETLLVKGKEYVRNNNPLHNFEEGAKITNEHPSKVLDGFLLKHIISYRDMLKDIEQGNIPTIEKIEEKFGDIIVYFIIQEIIFTKSNNNGRL